MKTQYAVPLYWVLMVVAVLALQGCASIPAPQTNDQKVAYAEATLTGFLNSAAVLRESGRLSSTDAQKIVDMAEPAYAALKAARGAKDQDALTYLRTAQTILIEINKYLQEKQR